MIKSTVVEGWKAEARAEERLETSADMLLQVLEARFGPPPADLAQAVRAVKDVDMLKRCVPAAVQADTLDAFRRAVNL